MPTASERLQEVQQAIRDLLENGQEVRKGDRSLRRVDLASLRLLESQLQQQAAQEQRAAARRSRVIRVYSRGKGI